MSGGGHVVATANVGFAQVMRLEALLARGDQARCRQPRTDHRELWRPHSTGPAGRSRDGRSSQRHVPVVSEAPVEDRGEPDRPDMSGFSAR